MFEIDDTKKDIYSMCAHAQGGGKCFMWDRRTLGTRLGAKRRVIGFRMDQFLALTMWRCWYGEPEVARPITTRAVEESTPRHDGKPTANFVGIRWRPRYKISRVPKFFFLEAFYHKGCVTCVTISQHHLAGGLDGESGTRKSLFSSDSKETPRP